jgi:hypothetical protein
MIMGIDGLDYKTVLAKFKNVKSFKKQFYRRPKNTDKPVLKQVPGHGLDIFFNNLC